MGRKRDQARENGLGIQDAKEEASTELRRAEGRKVHQVRRREEVCLLGWSMQPAGRQPVHSACSQRVGPPVPDATECLFRSRLAGVLVASAWRGDPENSTLGMTWVPRRKDLPDEQDTYCRAI